MCKAWGIKHSGLNPFDPCWIRYSLLCPTRFLTQNGILCLVMICYQPSPVAVRFNKRRFTGWAIHQKVRTKVCLIHQAPDSPSARFTRGCAIQQAPIHPWLCDSPSADSLEGRFTEKVRTKVCLIHQAPDSPSADSPSARFTKRPIHQAPDSPSADSLEWRFRQKERKNKRAIHPWRCISARFTRVSARFTR